MLEDLIYDIGMHQGQDTDFYLRKGFRVVAVEANPELAHRATSRFADAIGERRLHVINKAIASDELPVTLYIHSEHDEWSTTSSRWARTKLEHWGGHFTEVSVPAVRFEDLLDRYGTPYYLKVDIEGNDGLCLGALHSAAQRPRYLSVELDPDEDPPFPDLHELHVLGYREFKLINQQHNDKIALPYPPNEGRYVAQSFDGRSSGPFGEETPGAWATLDVVLPRYEQIVGEKDLDAWYDVHAKLARAF